MLNKKNLLITGGTGSLGNELVTTILKKYPKINKIVIFSRDELKQSEMSRKFKSDKLRFFIGDIRDAERLSRALNKINIVIHAAALKQVPASEYNPTEFIKTNVIGAHNLLEQSVNNKVSQIVALSTDKAAAPVNLYGATKLCSDKLFVAANQYYGYRINSSVVRYGNVMNSRGSVLPLFRYLTKKNLPFTITDKDMTRFNISLKEGVDLVLHAIKNSKGGEIFVPKISSYKILDLAKAVKNDFKIQYIGIRPGEKLHEEMITSSDALTTIDVGKNYIILPSSGKNSLNSYKTKKYKRVPKNFSYNSKNNKNFLTVSQLREIIKNIKTE